MTIYLMHQNKRNCLVDVPLSTLIFPEEIKSEKEAFDLTIVH